mgnify:CR=1 FL=1
MLAFAQSQYKWQEAYDATQNWRLVMSCPPIRQITPKNKTIQIIKIHRSNKKSITGFSKAELKNDIYFVLRPLLLKILA